MFRFHKFNLGLSLIPIAIVGSLTAESHAALLVYEGFADYQAGSLQGIAASSSSTGLSGNWEQTTSSHSVVTSGLSFEGLAYQGGALSIGSGTTISGIGLSNSAALAPGSTLYTSYLVRQNINANYGSSILTRIHDSSATSSGGYFSAFADGRASQTAAVGYHDIWNPSNSLAGSSPIVSGQTYIVISSFTNVGVASAGDAHIYVLNQLQFSNLLAADIHTLGSREAGTGNDQVWSAAVTLGASGSGTFNSSDYLQILTLETNGVIDELRYGTTLGDVLPIPEPSATLLLGAFLSILGSTRRRR
jgi:hypothetical protein